MKMGRGNLHSQFHLGLKTGFVCASPSMEQALMGDDSGSFKIDCIEMSAAKIPVTTHSFTLSMNKPPYQTEEHWPQQMRLTNVPIISTPRDVNRINLSLLETLF